MEHKDILLVISCVVLVVAFLVFVFLAVTLYRMLSYFTADKTQDDAYACALTETKDDGDYETVMVTNTHESVAAETRTSPL